MEDIIMKLTCEDIKKYGTVEEKNRLKESDKSGDKVREKIKQLELKLEKLKNENAKEQDIKRIEIKIKLYKRQIIKPYFSNQLTFKK